MRKNLQADDRAYKRGNKEEAPEAGGFLKDKDPNEDGTGSAYSRPYGISRTDRQPSSDLDQPQPTDGQANQETAPPQRDHISGHWPCLSQARSKTSIGK